MRRSLSRRPRRPLAERPGILPDVTAAVGATPLVALDRIAAGVAPRLVGKLEHLNPGGSVKDRIALPMIEAAERAGLLKPGGVIVEPTSGNTGVGLAQAAAVKGYRCIFVMADKQSEEKRALLRAYGAEVVICPSDVGPDDERSYYRVSDRLLRETPGAWKPDQYTNPANPEAHYVTTGPEIWEATDGRVTHFVVALGTGGTVSGTGRYLKEQNKDVQVVGVPDPRYGEELMAWIVTRGDAGLDREAVAEFCKGKVAHYKVPRYVQVVSEFPMTVTGKVQKFKLREQAIEELGLAEVETA